MTSEFFQDDKRFLGKITIKADPKVRDAFFASVLRAGDWARLRLETAPDNANALFAITRYDFNISKKWFVFGQLDLLHDRFQHLDLRLAPNGGLGYHFINTEKDVFDLFAGGGLNKEFFTDSTSRASGEALLGESYAHQFSKTTSLTESFQFFPNLKRTGEFRYVFNFGLNSTLTRILSWQLNFANLYLSNPPRGVKTSD